MLSQSQISHLAKLSRLSLSDEEFASFPVQVDSILSYVATLQEVDTEGVQEMERATEGENAWRADDPVACTAQTRADVIMAFPRKEGDLAKTQGARGGKQ
ncbi:Asp-tRNA(Asn)/Glu-tRNA(Gln) amidotransferase subunit GatC [Candidatus Uhrbacteria bacterium]|nr:Asp-tRNA(Asn)/Glu-tRNA(Gln) amidotransferase subunit GatC [Candidatus Uhrbacteria bacterium]